LLTVNFSADLIEMDFAAFKDEFEADLIASEGELDTFLEGEQEKVIKTTTRKKPVLRNRFKSI
jgi:hypothetical protein